MGVTPAYGDYLDTRLYPQLVEALYTCTEIKWKQIKQYQLRVMTCVVTITILKKKISQKPDFRSQSRVYGHDAST